MNPFVLMSGDRSYLGKVTAAGLFLFRRRVNDCEYLLLKSVGKCDAYWSPPNGRLVASKNVLETAKIETKKLTGYTSLDYNVFERHKYKLKYNDDAGSRNEIMYYLTELSNGNKPPALRPDRHGCFAWATFEDACRLAGSFEQKRMFRFFRDIIRDKGT